MHPLTTDQAINRIYTNFAFAHCFLYLALQRVRHLFGNDVPQTEWICVEVFGETIEALVDIPEAETAEAFYSDYVGLRVTYRLAQPQDGDLRVVGYVGGECCLQIRVLEDGKLHVVIEAAAVIKVGNH